MRAGLICLAAVTLACKTTPKQPTGPVPLSAGTLVVFGATANARNTGIDPDKVGPALEAAAAQAKGLKIISRGEAERLLHGRGMPAPVLDRSGMMAVEALRILGAEYGLYGVVDRTETIGVGMLAVMVKTDGDRSGEWMRGGQPEVLADLPRQVGALIQDLGASVTEPIKYSNGMVLTVTELGKGARPKLSERVKVHYEGRLEDGTVFDSSIKRGEPAVFGLDRVIQCWQDAVPKLRVGSKAKLICPPGIAYGERGSPPLIPPNATLNFSVELISIEK